MKSSSKKRIILLMIIVVGIASVIRIRYINTVQRTTGVHSYKLNERFEYSGFEFEAVEAALYTAAEMQSKFKEIQFDALDENDLLITLKIKNLTEEEKTVNITTFTLQCGLENGGGVNPYLYPYLNPETGGGARLGSGEERMIQLAFPVEETAVKSEEQLKLIISLYPEKYEIIIRE